MLVFTCNVSTVNAFPVLKMLTIVAVDTLIATEIGILIFADAAISILIQ